MAENSKIEWTAHTFNPWEGCQKVSPGCANCYAERRDQQYHGGAHWGQIGTRKGMSEAYWKQPLKWNRDAEKAGERRRVFCASLADVFEDRPELIETRDRLFALIDQTPNLDWLLLTKRPENIKKLWPFGWYDDQFTWENIWIGTTVENQEQANKRIPHLLNVPARVRFLSCEPLLGPIDLSHFANSEGEEYGIQDGGIHWVICGGESGSNARPMHPDWARDLRDQCTAARVSFFFKQWGEYWPGEAGRLYRGSAIDFTDGQSMVRTGKKAAGRELDGREWSEFPANAYRWWHAEAGTNEL